MELDAKGIIANIFEDLKTIAQCETAVGKEIKVGDFTLVPIARISIGVGGGSGMDRKDKKGGGVGGGGGVKVEPVAVIAVKDDKVSLLSIGRAGTIKGIFEAIPETIEKLKEMKERREGRETKDEVET